MNPLAQYVQGRVTAGLSRAQVREELLAVGWSEDDADAAYRDALVALGIPVPSAGLRPAVVAKSSTLDIAVNFFSFVLLCIVATALGTLLFQVIDTYVPDPLTEMRVTNAWHRMSAMHYAIASLVIGFPLYAAAVRLWIRSFRQDEFRTESRLTKWLTYIVLLLVSATIVGDLIAVLYMLLQGEITARFFLKALTVFVIAGMIFGFYYVERRAIQYRRAVSGTAFRVLGWSGAGMVLVATVLGLIAAGPPETARKRAFDMERETHLHQLSGCIVRYALDLGELPSSLRELARTNRYAHCVAYSNDPETRQEYEYRIVTPSRSRADVLVSEFELCATFALASLSDGGEHAPVRTRTGIWGEHGVGRHCNTVVAVLSSGKDASR